MFLTAGDAFKDGPMSLMICSDTAIRAALCSISLTNCSLLSTVVSLSNCRF